MTTVAAIVFLKCYHIISHVGVTGTSWSNRNVQLRYTSCYKTFFNRCLVSQKDRCASLPTLTKWTPQKQTTTISSVVNHSGHHQLKLAVPRTRLKMIGDSAFIIAATHLEWPSAKLFAMCCISQSSRNALSVRSADALVNLSFYDYYCY